MASDFSLRRTRQNHALEHASLTLLAEKIPHLALSARSNTQGFIIFGDTDLDLLSKTIDEALQRLQAGEAELAIHPNCGTNFAVGMVISATGILMGSFTRARTASKVLSFAASGLAGVFSARPLGTLVQKHITTLPDLHGVKVTSIARRTFFGMKVIDVRTIQE